MSLSRQPALTLQWEKLNINEETPALASTLAYALPQSGLQLSFKAL